MKLNQTSEETLDNSIKKLSNCLYIASRISEMSSGEREIEGLNAAGRIGLALAELLKLKASLG